MRRTLPFILLLCASGVHAATVNDWRALLNQGKTDEARMICSEAVKSPDRMSIVKGYNCLANLALTGKDIAIIEKSDAGGGSIRPGYKAKDVQRAVGYLDKSIDVAPEI